MTKQKIAVFSGPTSTIGNSPTLVTSNKGRHPGERVLEGRYDHLAAQLLYEPVASDRAAQKEVPVGRHPRRQGRCLPPGLRLRFPLFLLLPQPSKHAGASIPRRHTLPARHGVEFLR